MQRLLQFIFIVQIKIFPRCIQYGNSDEYGPVVVLLIRLLIQAGDIHEFCRILIAP